MRHTYIYSICLLVISIAGYGQAYAPEKGNGSMKVKPVPTLQAYAFNLHDVKLTGGPFLRAMEADKKYLLSIEPGRLLHRFHKHAGLPMQGAVYGGWEHEGLSGHTLGHYLSAISMMYAGTGEQEFRRRTDYIVHELKRCQEARKTGYVGAIEKEDSIFGLVAQGQIKSGGFDLNGGWSPWYTVHKVMAGLADAYMLTGNKEALNVLEGMGTWVDKTVSGLNDEQREKMLTCEYGGMNDVLALMYGMTGNKKYLDLSLKFHDNFVLGKLEQQIDPMPGKHSNTNVPKAIGTATRYELTGRASDKIISSFFWDRMVHHHSYVIGGNSNYEYCGEPDKLNDRLSDNTCETCNTYNMLKLTRHLFLWQPNSKYGDYYERALYNHILASQNPSDGMMCYFVPLRMGTKKTFSDQFNTFTCCVGSGMENHSKYAESIYFEGRDGSLYVNLFIPSELNWRSRGIKISQQTNFPESGLVNFLVEGKKRTFSLKIRKPSWAVDGVTVTVNGKPEKVSVDSEGYIAIKRAWGHADKVIVNLPMSLHTESMPDNVNRIAFLFGPVVLAGQLGTTMPDPMVGTPVLLTDNKNINDWVKREDQSLTFQVKAVGKPFDPVLKPFYQTIDQYYSVYWDYFTPEAWTKLEAEYEAEKKRQAEIAARTIDIMRLGEMQPERDHNLKASENSYTDQALGRSGREARSGGYFSFDIKVDPSVPNELLCTYLGDDKNRQFDILIDGEKLATQELPGAATGKFFDIVYEIPPAMIAGKSKVNVTVSANHNKTAGRIFGVRVLKSQP
ncbi:MAG TPA: beta-L-arabinofuranosidase domain-containing protein [Flavitalea sp.]|nr:beta-L-arabinofuranosidase domain-containing protein [Flavitalea sp.]